MGMPLSKKTCITAFEQGAAAVVIAFKLGKIGFPEFRMGDQELQHGFHRAKILDAPCVDQFQHQTGIEFAHQNR
jgi:hypothetical protein